MDSNSRKKRKPGANSRRNGRSRSGQRRERPAVKASSSFSSTTASCASIEIQLNPPAPAVSDGYLKALFGVCVLVLFGGGQHSMALGVALILPGISLLWRPPVRGLGKWMNLGLIGLLGSLLLAFVPMFYWGTPEWRVAAVEDFGIELPWMLSVQPWISLEAFLLATAGVCWLYVAANWEINYKGRQRFCYRLSWVMAIFAALVLCGNFYSWRYLGGSTVSFSFFPDDAQISTFLTVGGIVALGYGMEGLRGRKLANLIGLAAATLCIVAVTYVGSPGGVLLYVVGIILWYIFNFRNLVGRVLLRIAIPLALMALSYFMISYDIATVRATDVNLVAAGSSDDFSLLVPSGVTDMIMSTPLTGVGVGNYSAVFPQYREGFVAEALVSQPDSDWLWLGVEGGVVALCLMGALCVLYFWKCRTSVLGRAGAYRMIALTAVVLFFLQAFMGVSGHYPGCVYLVILFVAQALPPAKGVGANSRPLVWRVLGGSLLFWGIVWLFGGLFGLPSHSATTLSIAQARVVESRTDEEWDRMDVAAATIIDWQPLNWRGYSARAEAALNLSGESPDVVADFQRARYVEPRLAQVPYEEGVLWLSRNVTRTVDAWKETLIRSAGDDSDYFELMLNYADESAVLMERMIGLSELDTDYRVRLIMYLSEEACEREILKELAIDSALEQFSVEQRALVVEQWIGVGELVSVEAYLLQHGDSMEEPWRLWADLRASQGRFEEAIAIIRHEVPIAEIPELGIELGNVDRLSRAFYASSNDIIKGTLLLEYYLEQQEYDESLRVVDRLLKRSDPPLYVYYWRAQILYEVGTYSASLFAFQVYLEQLEE